VNSIDAHARRRWLLAEINEEKSRIVGQCRGESFGLLGLDSRGVRSLRGRWRAQYTPKLKKPTALLAKLKDVFRRHQSQPIDRVIKLINPVLRGWVNYFMAGHSSECCGARGKGRKQICST
jgi:RNA-directed DNA polymerase